MQGRPGLIPPGNHYFHFATPFSEAAAAPHADAHGGASSGEEESSGLPMPPPPPGAAYVIPKKKSVQRLKRRLEAEAAVAAEAAEAERAKEEAAKREKRAKTASPPIPSSPSTAAAAPQEASGGDSDVRKAASRVARKHAPPQHLVQRRKRQERQSARFWAAVDETARLVAEAGELHKELRRRCGLAKLADVHAKVNLSQHFEQLFGVHPQAKTPTPNVCTQTVNNMLAQYEYEGVFATIPVKDIVDRVTAAFPIFQDTQRRRLVRVIVARARSKDK